MDAEVLLIAGGVRAVGLAVGVAVWLFWALSACYLMVLALGALFARRRSAPCNGRLRRFCVVVPAHDEELLIKATLESILALDYPAELFSVVVVADNCTDGTGELARAKGAETIERTDVVQQGKGYALEFGIARLLHDPRVFEAFVVFDADSEVSPEFLRAMNAAMDSGFQAVQGWYDVQNVHESWRTRLMTCALAIAHYVKPMGRSALGLSTGLKGNGMCFSREVLERVPWSGASITEDIEYTLRLVCEGIRVGFEPGAVVIAQMPVSGRQAASQRVRWEAGRYALFAMALRLFWDGFRRRSVLLIDRAIELIVPPLAELFLVPLIAAVGAAFWLAVDPASEAARAAFWAWVYVMIALITYLGIGLAAARVPLNVVSALAFAPLYVGWKLALYAGMVVRGGPAGWKRTERRTLATSSVCADRSVEPCERL